MRAKKILVYGGSFDPPHAGHVSLLKAALRSLRPDLSYVVPSYHAPLKPGARAGARDRLSMARLALGEPEISGCRVKVSPFESSRPRTTYTWQTLRHFRRLHPDAELYFLAGTDTLKSFGAWARPNEVLSLCRFLVGRRPGAHLSRAFPHALWLPGLFPAVSSTGLRARLLADKDVSGELTRRVLRHIRRRGLYGKALRRRLARELGPKRYRHCLAVCRMALKLALRHGQDPEAAALAGLLHDYGRQIPRARLAGLARAGCLAETARRKPRLLHGHAGSELVRRRLGIRDPRVLSAIRKHVLGDGRMSALDRLVYTADACSADRRFPEAEVIRRAALRRLDEGFLETVRTKLHYVLRDKDWMHPMGPRLWNAALEALQG